MEIQLFINLISHIKKTAKRSQGIKQFYSFIKMLNLTKKFKYQDYQGQDFGIIYYCIDSKKWLVFDDCQAIPEYIEKKASKKYSLPLPNLFDIRIPENNKIELILDLIVSASFDQEKEETIWDFDALDEFEPDYTESVVEYKGKFMEMSEYDEIVFSYLVLAVFDKYNDNISKKLLK